MQLVEYFLWLNQIKSPTNLLLSKAIVLVITSQLVSFFSTSFHFKTLNEDSKLYFPTIIFFSLFLLGTLATFYFVNWKTAYTFKNKNTCRLEWQPYQNNVAAFTGLLYLISMGLLSWLNYGEKGIYVLIVSLFAGIVYSGMTGTFKYKTLSFGSIWCFMIVLITILAGIFDFFP